MEKDGDKKSLNFWYNRITNRGEKTTKEKEKALYEKEVSLCASETEFFDDNIFPYFELWYFNVALSSFSMSQIITILAKVLKYKDINKASHLNFKNLAANLHYDYEDKRHINIYKKRIIEKYL